MNLAKYIELLEGVKRLLGRDKDELVFIGVADTAEYWWCAQKSVFSNREMELSYFMAFLDDVIKYALELGHLEPSRRLGGEELGREVERILEEITAERLMELRDKITLDDINYLLKKRREERGGEGPCIDPLELPKGLSAEDALEITRIVESLPSEESLPKVLEKIRRLSPRAQGEILEQCFAERYATIRWNFPWREYVAVGVPDGMTEEFVYEFKATAYPIAMKRVALAQADIYGYFFKRPEKRVQILDRRAGEVYTYHEPVDVDHALETLEEFRAVEKGEREPKPPRGWKCRSCEYKEECPVYARGRG